MIPRPGTGQTLVPKEGNPNVMRVYEPMDFSGVIGASVTPSFRPTLGGMSKAFNGKRAEGGSGAGGGAEKTATVHGGCSSKRSVPAHS